MTRWISLGIIAVSAIIMLMAADGFHSLTGSNGPDAARGPLDFSLVKPAFAQAGSSSVSFFEDNGGLSSYSKFKAISTQEMVDISDLLFTEVIAVGQNWRIGKVRYTSGSIFNRKLSSSWARIWASSSSARLRHGLGHGAQKSSVGARIRQ